MHTLTFNPFLIKLCPKLQAFLCLAFHPQDFSAILFANGFCCRGSLQLQQHLFGPGNTSCLLCSVRQQLGLDMARNTYKGYHCFSSTHDYCNGSHHGSLVKETLQVFVISHLEKQKILHNRKEEYIKWQSTCLTFQISWFVLENTMAIQHVS